MALPPSLRQSDGDDVHLSGDFDPPDDNMHTIVEEPPEDISSTSLKYHLETFETVGGLQLVNNWNDRIPEPACETEKDRAETSPTNKLETHLEPEVDDTISSPRQPSTISGDDADVAKSSTPVRKIFYARPACML
jgi:hypothetical protein